MNLLWKAASLLPYVLPKFAYMQWQFSNTQPARRIFFALYSKICKYEFPKRSLYLYWDNFKQSVGLQGFYQFYYTLAERAAH